MHLAARPVELLWKLVLPDVAVEPRAGSLAANGPEWARALGLSLPPCQRWLHVECQDRGENESKDEWSASIVRDSKEGQHHVKSAIFFFFGFCLSQGE